MLPAIVLTFIAIFMAILAGFLYVSSVRESARATIKRRLRAIALSRDSSLSADLKSDLLKEISPLERIVHKFPFALRLERLIDHAGFRIKVTRFIQIPLAIFLLLLILALVLQWNFYLSLALISLVPLTPFLFLMQKKKERQRQFTELFPEALTMIARSIRAGHSLSGAVEIVGAELSDPVAELFKTAYEQQKLGLNVTESLQNMNERMDSMDLRFLTTAVAINSTVGGNLAEVLDKLAETVRERLRIRRQVQVFTAQGRLSGYILGALPIIVFVVFNIMMPGYEDVLLKEKSGNIMLFAAFIMQLIGFLIIRKIISIRI